MANPYSTRFLAWEATTSPAPYTVPTGFIVVMRDIDVVSGGGAIINWIAGINGLCKLAGGQFTIEALNQFQTWRGRQVVYPGEIIYFLGDGPTDGAISGYLLGYGP
jgi:hypothetical protein